MNQLLSNLKCTLSRTQKQVIEDMGGGHPAVLASSLLSSSGLTGGSRSGGPVGYWKFDEGHSTTANNSGSGGSALNGTLTGMATAPSTTTSGWTQAGKFNRALNFDGSDDYVSLGSTSTYANMTQGTITWWSKISSNTNENAIFSVSNNTSATQTEFWIDYDLRNGGNNLQAILNKDGTTQWWFTTSTTSFNATNEVGNWHYFSLVQNGTTPALYIDGKLISLTGILLPIKQLGSRQF